MRADNLFLSCVIENGDLLWFYRQRKTQCYAHVTLREMKFAEEIINY